MWLSLMRLTVSWLLSLGSSPTLLYAHVASAKSTVLSAKGYECIAFTSCATGRNMLRVYLYVEVCIQTGTWP